MRVFVVEDEIEGYRKVIKDALLGHEVTYALSRPQAQELWKGLGAYDLVLLDHDMEGYYESSEAPNTGYQFLKWALEAECPDGPYLDKVAPLFVVHTQNNIGALNMLRLLRDYQLGSRVMPFHTTIYPRFLVMLIADMERSKNS